MQKHQASIYAAARLLRRERHTPGWMRAFIVAVVDLTSRLTGPWSEPACLAQHLACFRLMDTAEEIAETVGIELPRHWRAKLLASLVAESDVALLYDSATELPEGLAFEAWFTPYGPQQALPPYVIPYPTI